MNASADRADDGAGSGFERVTVKASSARRWYRRDVDVDELSSSRRLRSLNEARLHDAAGRVRASTAAPLTAQFT